MVLQVLIAATGNYTFFNILTVILCLPCFDDQCFFAPPTINAPTPSPDTIISQDSDKGETDRLSGGNGDNHSASSESSESKATGERLKAANPSLATAGGTSFVSNVVSWWDLDLDSMRYTGMVCGIFITA